MYSRRVTSHRLSTFIVQVSAVGVLLCSTGTARAEDAPTKSSDLRAAARLELASAYFTQRQFGTALQEVNQALVLLPNYAPAYNMLGLIQMELSQPKEADAAFRQAMTIDPRDPDTRNNYGWFLCQNNQVAGAFEHFEAAAANPMYQTPEKALYNAGRCAREGNDKPKAIQYFSAALRIQPRATAVMYELADMQYQDRNYQAVLDVLDRIDVIEGPTAKSLWLALRTEYRLGHRNEVGSYGSQLLKKFPDSPEAILFRAKSFD